MVSYIAMPPHVSCVIVVYRRATNDRVSFLTFRSAETDSHGQEYVILDADIRTFEDPKRSFTFSLKCQGVPEMYFSSEDEDTQVEWLSKLAAASNAPDNSMSVSANCSFAPQGNNYGLVTI